MSEKIITLNAHERLLARVNHYIGAVDQLISKGDEALDLLLPAFKVADENMKIKIVLLLGTLANGKVVPHLLSIMRDDRQSESIRQTAAIQLSVVGGILPETDHLVNSLFEELANEEPFARANAAFALGWEGNLKAAPFLIECLFDDQTEVQQAAVNALSNLKEDKIFKVLAERLQQSPKEQQRAILYNLGHFSSRYDEIAQICKTFIHHSDADLRLDALEVLNTVRAPEDNLPIYEHCLRDSDSRIRKFALSCLAMVSAKHLISIEKTIRRLLKDDDVRVHQAAVRLIHQMHPTAAVQERSPSMESI